MSAVQASAAGQFQSPIIAHPGHRLVSLAEMPGSKNIAPDDLAGAYPANVAAVLTELSALLFPPVAEQLVGLSPASKQAAAVRANLRQLHSLGLLSDSELAAFGDRATPECGQGDSGRMALIAAATRTGPVVSALLGTGASGPTYRPPSLPLDGATPDPAFQPQKGILNRKPTQGAARRRLDLSASHAHPATAATTAGVVSTSTATGFKTEFFDLDACASNTFEDFGEPTPLSRSESMSSLDEIEASVGDATSEHRHQVTALLILPTDTHVGLKYPV